MVSDYGVQNLVVIYNYNRPVNESFTRKTA